MPNWCMNTVEITHEDPAMIERARAAFIRGEFLNEFIPVPLCLTETMSGSYGDPEKQAALEKSRQDNLDAHNYPTWYEFCTNEWGTKWDVGGGDEVQDIPNGLMLTFDSAWAPPINAYDRLMDMGFNIRAMYYEPGMCFAGIWEDGDDNYFEYGGMSAVDVAQQLPVELDEAYGISEQIAEYEEELDEEAE